MTRDTDGGPPGSATVEAGSGGVCAANFSAPGGIRTPDLEIRSLPLYPTELRAQTSSLLPNAIGSTERDQLA